MEPSNTSSAISLELNPEQAEQPLSNQGLRQTLIQRQQLAWAAFIELGAAYQETEEETRCRKERSKYEHGSPEAIYWQEKLDEEAQRSIVQLRKEQSEWSDLAIAELKKLEMEDETWQFMLQRPMNEEMRKELNKSWGEHRARGRAYKETAQFYLQQSLWFGRRAWIARVRSEETDPGEKSEEQMKLELEEIRALMPECYSWKPWKKKAKRGVDPDSAVEPSEVGTRGRSATSEGNELWPIISDSNLH